VNVENDVGPGQVQQVRVAGHVLRVVTQPVTAVVGRDQALPLEQRAPRPVEHRDALVKKFPQPFRGVCRW
jgi:hypothetical protein